MKKKIVLFGVALAALATFNSCSNENDMMQVIEEPVVKGTPFVVNIAGDGTRGTEISAISAFKLVGAQGTSDPWIDNYVFTKPDDAWVATDHTDLTWPQGDDTHTFYAVCDNTNSVADITNGKFDYTVPTTFSGQKDLLVSYVTDAPNGTPVTLAFKHALSSVKFKVGFDNEALSDESNDIHITVTKITLYHIATKGSYDFATGTWTVDAGTPYVDYEINLKQPVTFTPGPLANFIELDDTYIDETNYGEIYVLPHKPTAWEASDAGNTPLANSYIGVTCQLYYYTGDTFADSYGIDEDSDDDEIADAKEEYTNDYGGKLSTDGEEWLSDKIIKVMIPESYELNVVTESDLQSKNTAATDNTEEVYLPLTMTNGFGVNKTNTLNIRVNNVRRNTGKYVTTWITTEIGG